MARHTLMQMFGFEDTDTTVDRLMLAILMWSAWANGHGDIGHTGIAEFDLIEFAEAVQMPPGEALRAMRDLERRQRGFLCELDNKCLFVMPRAWEADFAHLYKTRGFEGHPPRLPAWLKPHRSKA